MIDNILNLLQLAKQEGWEGENIDIAHRFFKLEHFKFITTCKTRKLGWRKHRHRPWKK